MTESDARSRPVPPGRPPARSPDAAAGPAAPGAPRPAPDRDALSAAVEEFAARASDAATIDVEAFVARWPEADRDALRRRCREALAIQATLRRHLDAARPARERDALARGASVGEFVVDHEVGRGPLGSRTYVARQPSLDRLLTLTVFGGADGAPEALRRRVRRAATASAALRHPGIVAVLSVGEAEGRPFVAAECIEGLTLAALLREDRRAWPGEAAGWWPEGPRVPGRIARAAEIAAQVAEAVQYAHEAGLLHRGLQPERVLLDRQGRVHVDAFDLADDPVAAAGAGRGDAFDALADDAAVHYLSPEQAVGRPARVDGRTDVFALGVLLYEMLARARPFVADTIQGLLAAIARAEPRPVRQAEPDVPADLATICHAALEKRPARRYATMGELAADLRRFLGHQSIRARPPSPLARAIRSLLRRKHARA